MLLIAHRGDTVNFPENTIEAFESAFDKGADGVELDVQLVDGQLIVVHDFQFDRSKSYPQFKQVLEKFIEKGRLEIDLKSFSLDIINPLQVLLSKYDTSNVEITTTELVMIHPIKKAFPDVNVGAIFGSDHYQSWMSEDTLIRKTIELMQTMQADVAHLSGISTSNLSPKLINELHQNNFKAHYHIPKTIIEDQLEVYNLCLSLNIDQCTFEDVGLLDVLGR